MGYFWRKGRTLYEPSTMLGGLCLKEVAVVILAIVEVQPQVRALFLRDPSRASILTNSFHLTMISHWYQKSRKEKPSRSIWGDAIVCDPMVCAPIGHLAPDVIKD
jgi:hypothetical protein